MENGGKNKKECIKHSFLYSVVKKLFSVGCEVGEVALDVNNRSTLVAGTGCEVAK